ncbi:MAG: DUF4230 domain-containing protein [Lachnospiraceae bacterium]|nr:DUF4230 domain-containing protein [Candidatus Merdinaster equi]
MKSKINKLKNGLKKLGKNGFLITVIVIVVIVFAIVLFLRNSAISAGADIGKGLGTTVATAVGSFEGMLEIPQAVLDGKKEGLSAKDTSIELANNIKSVGNLIVLNANVKIKDLERIGDQYAALYLLKGNVVFSVNLSKVEVTYSDDGIEVILPPFNPKEDVRLYVDATETEKIAEYQKYFFSGSTEDGFDAFINSFANVIDEAEKRIENYDSLVQIAREEAVKQVTALVDAMHVETMDTRIVFEETK